jgi:hypothetical protein
MCKNVLQERHMGDAAYIKEAADWASALTRIETRGPGVIENAWRRLEARYGVPTRAFWSLRYRRPKEIAVSIYFGLRAAYEAECERQMRRLKHELAITKKIAGADHPAVASTETLVGANKKAHRS